MSTTTSEVDELSQTDSPRQDREEVDAEEHVERMRRFSFHSVRFDEETFLDEHHFPLEVHLKAEYDSWLSEHKKKMEKILTKLPWKEAKLNKNTKKTALKELIKAGIPSTKHRAAVWSVATGGFQKKWNANSNVDGSYYEYLLGRVEKIGLDAIVITEIDKDLARTFPGHPVLDTKPYLDKLQRVLQAFAMRNEAIAYCQSMNFIAGMSLLIMQTEEDAFWLLTSIVEDYCPGQYGRTMFQLQVDTLVLQDLLSEKLNDVYNHTLRIGFDLVIVSTKLFMCLFVGLLPTETLLRVWDAFFVHGSKILFKAALTLFALCRDELIHSKDSMEFWQTLLSTARHVVNPKTLLKQMNKFKISSARVEELRNHHTMAMRKASKSAHPTKDSISLQTLTNKLDSFVSNLMFKKQERSIFDISPKIEAETLQSLPLPVDFIVQGVGTRYYSDGSKYQGAFVNGRRHGKGALIDRNGLVLYNGYWKYDRREGEGSGQDYDGNSYSGNWKADKYHGKGLLKLKESAIEYNGDWIDGKQEGMGTMSFPNGDKYVGQWKDNKRHGAGVYIWATENSSYDGLWANDKPEGKGILVFSDGSKYMGDFHSGRREGKGKMVYNNNNTYEGEWKNDVMHGKGIYMLADQNNKFEGQFKSGYRIEGGVKHWPDGAELENPEEERGGLLGSGSLFDNASNSFYKESIQRYMNRYQGIPVPTDSIPLMDLRANPQLTKAIEQIKRKSVTDVR